MLPVKQTIWHVISNRWNSAITEYALSCARATALLDYKPVFAALEGSPCADRAAALGFDVHLFSSFGLGSLVSFRKIFAELKPEFIFVYGGAETILSKFLSPAPRVIRFKGQEVGDPSLAGRLTHILAHSHVQNILAPSQVMTAQMRDLGFSQVFCLPLGVDTARFQPVSYAKPVRPELLIFGRFDPVKGHQEFFQIFSRMLKLWPLPEKPLLRVVGNPANVSVTHLERYAEAAGLKLGSELVISVGRLDDVATLLSRMTMGVICSVGSEVICRVAEEFLLCGTPVFVSGAGSLQEVLFGPEAGASYRDLSVEDAAEKLKESLMIFWRESADEKRARAEKARAIFSLETMAETLKSSDILA